jgi:hypothetical protein
LIAARREVRRQSLIATEKYFQKDRTQGDGIEELLREMPGAVEIENRIFWIG